RLLAELEAMRPDLAPASPLDASGAQSRLFEAVSQVLKALYGASPPGILFLDDLHWADAASLDLLAYLVRRLHDHQLCILVTWRGGKLSSNHPGGAIIAEGGRGVGPTPLSVPRFRRSGRPGVILLSPAASDPRPPEPFAGPS